MHNLRRFYNRNRKGIWMGILIIASLIILLQLINYFASQNNINKKIELTNKQDINSIEESANINLESSQSAVSGENISTNKLKVASETIGKFLNECNKGNVEAAYNMITDDCKQEIFNSVEIFKKAYYDNIFNGKEKSFDIENWIGDIYKVNIYEDMLSTGKSSDGYAKRDYITIKNTEQGYKLNINSYIGKEEINKITKKDNIEITIMNKKTYMNNEIYDIKVTNNTGKNINLDGLSNQKSLYIQDSKGAKYSAYTHELTTALLKIENGNTKELSIKFYSSYTSNKNINKMVFSDIIVYDGQGSDRIEFSANI